MDRQTNLIAGIVRDSTPKLDVGPNTTELTLSASLLRKLLHQALTLLDERPDLTFTVTVAGRPIAVLHQSPRTVVNDPTAAIFDKSLEKSSGKSAPEPQPIRNATRTPQSKR
jgi:hypothetical protein